MNEQLMQLIPWLGALLAGGAIVSTNPTVMEYATKAKDFAMSFLKRKTPTIPVDETADLSEALQYLSVHELLEELINRAEESSDTDGLMLLGAFGKHVYDLRLEPKVAPKAKASTKKGV